MYILSKTRLHSLGSIFRLFKARKTSEKKPGSPFTDEVQFPIAFGCGSLNIVLKCIMYSLNV